SHFLARVEVSDDNHQPSRCGNGQQRSAVRPLWLARWRTRPELPFQYVHFCRWDSVSDATVG
ncbi:unnamed protein product, partial [Mycena citricolor]